MHYCYNYSDMSWKNLHTFSLHPIASISQGTTIKLSPFWLALMFKGASPSFQVMLRFVGYQWRLMTMNSCHVLQGLTFTWKREDRAQTQCSDFKFRYEYCCPLHQQCWLTQRIRVLRACFRTLSILNYHLNQYGAVLPPKKEAWMRTATRTEIIQK